MTWFYDAVGNYILWAGACGWLVAQFLKVVTGVFKKKKFSIAELLFGTGGMPSSHSAAVCALATACGISEGLDSPIFAVATVLAIIVMRDAMGMRQEVGKHARALNDIFAELMKSNMLPEDFNRTHRELVGHTPLQVYCGAATGIAVAFAMSFIPWLYQWPYAA